jgi:hypothetical protein
VRFNTVPVLVGIVYNDAMRLLKGSSFFILKMRSLHEVFRCESNVTFVTDVHIADSRRLALPGLFAFLKFLEKLLKTGSIFVFLSFILAKRASACRKKKSALALRSSTL